jgi:hypothetical protein
MAGSPALALRTQAAGRNDRRRWAAAPVDDPDGVGDRHDRHAGSSGHQGMAWTGSGSRVRRDLIVAEATEAGR